jgi:molybdopterin synthase catalytic subunit
MSEHKKRTIFVNGPIDPAFIADSISKHASNKAIGAHSIFLGQVRADEVDGKKVAAIDYTAYEEMASEQMTAIREQLFARYPLTCLHVYHSLGTVEAGAICLLVFTSSAHRKAANDACSELVERIKAELPIWGRELFEGDGHQWKVNT